MTPKKIIAVTGATGIQGGSTVRFLLEDGTFSVRGITRNPNSTAAKALIARGVEVCKADLDEPDSLAAAFAGAYGVFGLTNFWEYINGDRERKQGKALVDAAKKAGVQHFVWSTVDHTEFRPEHWESKADIDDYLKESGVPRTSLYTSFYFENFVNRLRLVKRPDGSFDFPVELIPDAKMAVYCAGETGAWALVAFKSPEQWVGKDIRVASEFISTREVANVISDLSGKRVHVPEITIDLTPNPGADSTTQGKYVPAFSSYISQLDGPNASVQSLKLLMFYDKPPFRDPELTRTLYPGTTMFRTWAKKHINEIVA